MSSSSPPRLHLVAFCNQRSDQLSFDRRLAQRKRYSLVALQAAGDLAVDPVVKTEFYIDQMYSIISPGRGINPFAVEDQWLVRAPWRTVRPFDGNRDVRVQPRIQ